MKKMLFGIFLMLSAIVVHAQELPKIIPPSPEAASLAKYTEMPVSLASGLPSISVPIYGVQHKDINVPVSLSYHAGGIRVEERASRVGLGWSLNAGGVVSRTVQGLPDDHPLGYIYSNTKVQSVANVPASNVSYWNTIKQGVSNNTLDMESDIYTFNFGGYSGRFVYNQTTNTFFQTPFSNIKIESIKESNKIVAWKFTTPDGVKYYFGKSEDKNRIGIDINKGTSSYSYTAQTGFKESTSETPSYISSWYLMDIISPVKTIVSFTYKANAFDVSYISRVQENDYYKACAGYDYEVSFVKSRTSKMYLEEIFWDNGKVQFVENTVNRLDDEHSKSLKRINVLNKNGSTIKSYVLNQSYFISDANTVQWGNFGNSTLRRHRLKLDSVQQVSGNEQIPPFTFEYNTTKLPSMFSHAQDYWGYYNGKLNNPNLIPEFYDTTTKLYFNGADRAVSKTHAQAGVLKKITYPTGGSAEFTYESNRIQRSAGINPNFQLRNELTSKGKHFYKNAQFSFTGNNFPNPTPKYETDFTINNGGYGLTKINTTISGCSGPNLNNHNCDYNIKIIGVTDPNYSFVINNTVVSLPLVPGMYKIQAFEEGEGADINPSQVSFDVNVQWYEEKTPDELIIGGLRINKMVKKDTNGAIVLEKNYNYNTFGTQNSSGYMISQPIFVDRLFRLYTCNPIVDAYKLYSFNQAPSVNVNGNIIGYKNVTELMLDNSFVEYTFDSYGSRAHTSTALSTESHIIKPDLYSNWLRGDLIKKESFKKEGNTSIKVQTIENEYEEVSTTHINNLGLKAVFLPLPVNTALEWKAGFYSGISEWRRLKKTVTTNIFDGESVVTTQNYVYNNNPLLHSEMTTVNSEGVSMKTKTYYVNDKSQLSGLSTSASVGIDSLKLQYRIATPIQVESYRNNVLQSTQRTSYKYWPTVGIVASDTIQVSKGSLVLEDRVVYHSYDDRGNPKEVSKADGTKVYYVWGYDKTQPIAKIEGVTGASLSSSQQSLITAAITASNNDTNAGTEATLRTKLSDLRNGFSSTPWVQVTTLTYDPLIGVTSITDARGNVMYYVYDSFNRLQYIKDKDGYVLKEHKYHYKN